MSQTVRLGPAEIDALARIAHAEARGDGVEGMQAVVATVLNRAATGRRDFGGSNIIDVLNHQGQYTPVTRAGSVDRLPPAPESVERMVAEFAASFSPETDPTSGATFFNSDGSNRFPSHLTIGGHTFHRGYNDQRVTVPTYTPELAEPVRTAYNIEAPTRTAQARPGPSAEETSLMTGALAMDAARQGALAAAVPPSRPTDLAARPDIRNRTLAGYDASLGQRGDVAQLQRGPELPGVRQAQLEYDNRGATRNQRLDPVLEARIAEAVGAVYGPDARAVVYSGGQPRPGEGSRVGSRRHDDGFAADVKVFDADGNQVRGDRLGDLAQFWGGRGYGSAGLEMRTGGIHLDAHNARPENRIPGAMTSYGGQVWGYGAETPAAMAAARRGFFDGELPAVYAATPPSPTQAVAARARNPANLMAFVEPPEPAQRQTRVAAATPVTMTDASPMLGGPYQSRTGRPNADVLRDAGIPVTGTPDVDAAATFILENPPAGRPSPARPAASTPSFAVPIAQAGQPASVPARPSAPSRSAALGYAPDVMRGMSREPDGVPRESGRFSMTGPAGPERAPVNVSTLTPSILGGFGDFGALTNTPQPQARQPQARSPRAMGAEDIAIPSVPSTFPARPAPGGPGAYPASPAARPVRTASAAAVPGTTAGAFPAPAAPPSRPAAPPAPAPAPRVSPAPLPPERPAFIANNPNAPRGIQMFERGAAGIGNFVEQNTRGIRSSLNDRYGSYYGGNMFRPTYDGMNEALNFANMDADMRGPGAPGLFDLVDRDFGGMSRGGRFAGSLVGGMVGGLPGAIVGGLTGGLAGEAMGFGRDRNAPQDSGGFLSSIGDFFGGLGGLGGTRASGIPAGGVADPYAGSGGMSATDFNNMDSAYR